MEKPLTAAGEMGETANRRETDRHRDLMMQYVASTRSRKARKHLRVLRSQPACPPAEAAIGWGGRPHSRASPSPPPEGRPTPLRPAPPTGCGRPRASRTPRNRLQPAQGGSARGRRRRSRQRRVPSCQRGASAGQMATLKT